MTSSLTGRGEQRGLEVTLGEPAHDTAKVTGTVPDGATLVFDAYRQDGDTATCTEGEPRLHL
jgi:hypothetical protein